MSETKPFSAEALQSAIDALPPEQGGIGVKVEGKDIGVQGAVSKSLGNGWTLTAAGSWFVNKGYAAAAWLGWKGKP